MRKNNRNRKKTRARQQAFEKPPVFETREVSDPTEIQRNGISILAVGPDDGEKPDEIQMIWHVPDAPYASCLTFKEPHQLGALIEQMIAHRNFVFPDAEPIDPNAQLKAQE